MTNKYKNHIKKFREKNPNLKCRKCGKSLQYSMHHYYCERCWWLK